MTHDKPEPPDMRGEAYTLRQRVENKIDELRLTRNEPRHRNHTQYLTGAIDMLRDVLDWMDDQEHGT